ncbi:hypothetical protein EMIT0215P_80152 [Pseudomonas serboccidentalis]
MTGLSVFGWQRFEGGSLVAFVGKLKIMGVILPLDYAYNNFRCLQASERWRPISRCVSGAPS